MAACLQHARSFVRVHNRSLFIQFQVKLLRLTKTNPLFNSLCFLNIFTGACVSIHSDFPW